MKDLLLEGLLLFYVEFAFLVDLLKLLLRIVLAKERKRP